VSHINSHITNVGLHQPAAAPTASFLGDVLEAALPQHMLLPVVLSLLQSLS
jgi:hypothetical protein